MKPILIAAAIGVLALPTIGAIRDFGWNSEAYQKRLVLLQNADEYYDYATAHPDTVFIAESNLPITDPPTFEFQWARNCTIWGGWRKYYPWYKDAMVQLGLPGVPTTDTLFLDNVRLVLGSDEMEETVTRYLSGLYGSVELEPETVLKSGIRIYKVERTQEG